MEIDELNLKLTRLHCSDADSDLKVGNQVPQEHCYNNVKKPQIRDDFQVKPANTSYCKKIRTRSSFYGGALPFSILTRKKIILRNHLRKESYMPGYIKKHNQSSKVSKDHSSKYHINKFPTNRIEYASRRAGKNEQNSEETMIYGRDIVPLQNDPSGFPKREITTIEEEVFHFKKQHQHKSKTRCYKEKVASLKLFIEKLKLHNLSNRNMLDCGNPSSLQSSIPDETIQLFEKIHL